MNPGENYVPQNEHLKNIEDTNNNKMTVDEMIQKANEGGIDSTELRDIFEKYKEEKDQMNDAFKQKVELVIGEVSKELFQSGIKIGPEVYGDPTRFANFIKSIVKLAGVQIPNNLSLEQYVKTNDAILKSLNGKEDQKAFNYVLKTDKNDQLNIIVDFKDTHESSKKVQNNIEDSTYLNATSDVDEDMLKKIGMQIEEKKEESKVVETTDPKQAKVVEAKKEEEAKKVDSKEAEKKSRIEDIKELIKIPKIEGFKFVIENEGNLDLAKVALVTVDAKGNVDGKHRAFFTINNNENLGINDLSSLSEWATKFFDRWKVVNKPKGGENNEENKDKKEETKEKAKEVFKPVEIEYNIDKKALKNAIIDLGPQGGKIEIGKYSYQLDGKKVENKILIKNGGDTHKVELDGSGTFSDNDVAVDIKKGEEEFKAKVDKLVKEYQDELNKDAKEDFNDKNDINEAGKDGFFTSAEGSYKEVGTYENVKGDKLPIKLFRYPEAEGDKISYYQVELDDSDYSMFDPKGERFNEMPTEDQIKKEVEKLTKEYAEFVEKERAEIKEEKDAEQKEIDKEKEEETKKEEDKKETKEKVAEAASKLGEIVATEANIKKVAGLTKDSPWTEVPVGKYQNKDGEIHDILITGGNSQGLKIELDKSTGFFSADKKADLDADKVKDKAYVNSVLAKLIKEYES